MSKDNEPKDIFAEIRDAIIHGTGYRRPPVEHQFKKGQSGNPKGRPRKSDKSLLLKQVLPMSNAAIMSKVLNEQLTVIQNGKRRRVSKAEVVQRNIDKQAMTGSVLANRDLRRQLLAEDEKRRLEIEADHQLHHQYLRARTKALDDAKRDGTPLKEFWIEPEDIIFTPDAMEQVRGPGCVTDKPHFEFCERFLKLLIFELTYDICNFARENEPVRVAVKFIAILQKLITSAAERASNAYWSYLQDNYICFFHRLATKERELVWAAIGWPVPRKRWLPPTPEKDLRWLEKHRDPIQKIIFDLEFGTRRRLRRGRVIR